jgi:hypothetical protein
MNSTICEVGLLPGADGLALPELGPVLPWPGLALRLGWLALLS